MNILYHGFDRLELSFMGAVGERVLDQLKEARNIAEEQSEATSRMIGGKNKRRVLVGPNGSQGGYRYMLRTGEQDLLFFIKHNNRIDQWNIRVIVQSLALATKGYQRCLTEIDEWLNVMEAKGEKGAPLATFSRIDYCIDVSMPKTFTFEKEHFVQHARLKTTENIELYNQSLNTTGIRIGKMPNREIGIYDKSKQVVETKKDHWWDIWGVSKSTLNGKIWRIEFRAGKEFLKKMELRTLDDFSAHTGSMFLAMHQQMRYCMPTTDSNRSRWPNHPLWDVIADTLIGGLGDYISDVDYHSTMPHLRDKKLEIMRKQMTGLCISRAALEGRRLDSLRSTFASYMNELLTELEDYPYIYREKFLKAKGRHAFIRET